MVQRDSCLSGAEILVSVLQRLLSQWCKDSCLGVADSCLSVKDSCLNSADSYLTGAGIFSQWCENPGFSGANCLFKLAEMTFLLILKLALASSLVGQISPCRLYREDCIPRTTVESHRANCLM